MKREREHLMAAYLAGDSVADELLVACRNEPELLRELAEHTAIDRLLTFQADEEDDSVFAAEVCQRIAGQADDTLAEAVQFRLHRETRWRPSRLLKLAATILVLVGVGVLLLQHRDPPTLAILESVTGEAYLGAGPKSRNVPAGTAFPSGTDVFCPPGINEAMVRCRDGSLFKVTSGTRVSFLIDDGQYRLTLREGLLAADVRKQPHGQPLVIVTPDLELTVVGTRFQIATAPEPSDVPLSSDLVSSTSLIVDEGRVEIRKNGSDDTAVVSAGESILVTQDQPIQTTQRAKFKVEQLEITHATYGARSSWIDVTSQMQALATDSLLIYIGPFSRLAGDPLPGTIKTLKLAYAVNGIAGETEFSERVDGVGALRSQIILPVPRPRQDRTATKVSQAKVSSNDELAFAHDVVDADLLHGLRPIAHGWTSDSSATPAAINDGRHGNTFALDQAASVAWSAVGATVEYDLGLGSRGNGWDIHRIQSIAAWVNAGFGNQAYVVEVKCKDADSFTVLATVSYEPFEGHVIGFGVDPGASKVTLSGLHSGVLASEVERIRFTAGRVSRSAMHGSFTLREIDVFGAETKTADSREAVEIESARQE